MRHVVVVGGGDPAPLVAAAGDRIAVHHWDDLLADRPETYDWPEVDERDAAALCYTSGTTGNPKGVAYSHRSIYLHSLQVCMPEGFGLGPTDRELAIVPMFHAMSWGLPYAAFLSGASLIMPDRFLQAAPIAEMIAAERPTLAGAVPTIWNDLLAYLDSHDVDTSSLKEVIVGGSACPPALMHAFARAARHRRDPRLGDDRDVPARLGVPAAGRGDRRRGLALPVHPGPGAGRGRRADRRAAGRAAARRRRRPSASWRSAGRG